MSLYCRDGNAISAFTASQEKPGAGPVVLELVDDTMGTETMLRSSMMGLQFTYEPNPTVSYIENLNQGTILR